MKFAFAYFTEAINTNGGYTKMIAKIKVTNTTTPQEKPLLKFVVCACLISSLRSVMHDLGIEKKLTNSKNKGLKSNK